MPAAATHAAWLVGAPAGAAAAPELSGRILVQFKATPTGAAVATAQAVQPAVPGLQLQRLVGEHQNVAVPQPSAAGGGPMAAAASVSSTALPPGAVMLYSITDGSSVAQKVAELRANPGEAVKRCWEGCWRGCRSRRRPWWLASATAADLPLLSHPTLSTCSRGGGGA